MEATTLAIEIAGLGKRFTVNQGYRDLLPWRERRFVDALQDINLRVPRGEVFGILGANGAGKTTMFKILASLTLPTTGTCRVLGHEVVEESKAARELLTYVVSEERSLLWRLTGRQNLQYFAALNNIPRRAARQSINRLLALLSLEEAADRRVMFYSTGMRQKLNMARGLLTDPQILLLDEPTRSLDPVSAFSLWRFIKEELVEGMGKTILLATHNLEEARWLCNQMAILHRGRVQASGSVAQLTARLDEQHRYSLKLHPSGNGVHGVLAQSPGVLDVQETAPEDGGPVVYNISLSEPEQNVPLLLDRVIAARGRVLACTPQEQSLSDVLETLSREGK